MTSCQIVHLTQINNLTCRILAYIHVLFFSHKNNRIHLFPLVFYYLLIIDASCHSL